MMWFLYGLSLMTPDFVKSETWRIWDRRMTWVTAHGVYMDFAEAYYCVRGLERTRLIIAAAKTRKL